MAAALFFWWRREKAKNNPSYQEQLQKGQKHFRELEGEGTTHQLHEISGNSSAAANPKEILSTEIFEVSAAKNHAQGDLLAAELDTISATEDRKDSLSPVLSPAPIVVSSPAFPKETVTSTSGNLSTNELAEEADIAVQELGLINLRKRALAAQAEALNSSPESRPGRQGEEYRELLQREARIATRLEEIESQHRSIN
jgi:hypothetical protein